MQPLPRNLDPSTGLAHAWPLAQAMLVQFAALLLVLFVSAGLATQGIASGLAALTLAQAACAVLIAWSLRCASWWLAIHAVFLPALLSLHSLALPAALPAMALALLLLLYGNLLGTRVPLFLTGRGGAQALLALLPQDQPLRFIDLGCGLGGLLQRLSLSRPNMVFSGMEIAPLPFALGWLRARMTGRRVQLRWGDFWSRDLGEFDVVYAFLSPAAMERLWSKASREMRAGSLLVSHRFIVPGVAPSLTLPTGPGENDRLLLWRMPGQGAGTD